VFNQPAFLLEAEKVVDDVADRVGGVTRYALLTGLLEKVEAQKNLSYYVRDKLNDVSFDELAKIQFSAVAGEVFLDNLAFDPELRKKTIEFLRSPITEADAKEYAEFLRNSASDTLYEVKVKGVPSFVKTALRNALRGSDIYSESVSIGAYYAEMLHKNFASAAPEYRAFLMEKILFPPNQQAVPMDVDPQTYVFDQTLPETEQYAKYGRSLLGNYLGSLRKDEEYVMRMYLSAMLVAEEPGNIETDPQKRVGKAIHTLLNSMDNSLAAEISQGIDSDPNTPDWLRHPEGKTDHAIPPLWVIHEMFEQNAQAEVQETTLRLGKVHGGSIGLAVELEKDTERMKENGYDKPVSRTMFKMVRRGAAEKVAIHSPRVKHMIDQSTKDYPELKPAKPIIDHARRSAGVQIDFRNAPIQTTIAQILTDGIQITVEGETFTVKEVPILKANSASHEMPWAPGTVFNKLPQDQKQKPALVLHTLENYIPLLGLQKDWDRHGGQAIVDGNTIYLLDRGGMALEAPSREDKELFGQTLAHAVNDHVMHKTPFNIAVTNAVNATADEEGNLNYYLASIARGQHNLGDLRRQLSTEQQMDSLISVFSTQQIDPVIMQAAFETLTPESQLWIGKKIENESGAKQSITISDPNIGKRECLTNIDQIQTVPLGEKPIEKEQRGSWRSKTVKPLSTKDASVEKTTEIKLRSINLGQSNSWERRA